MRSQTEVPRRLLTGPCDRIFARSHQLHHRQGKIGIMHRVGSLALLQEFVKRRRIRFGR